MIVSKYKLRNFLAEKLTGNFLQINEEDLFNFIRYDGIKGLEQYDDEELFKTLKEAIPEFDLTHIDKKDNNNFYLQVKKEHMDNAKDIEVDITRIIQMKMLA